MLRIAPIFTQASHPRRKLKIPEVCTAPQVLLQVKGKRGEAECNALLMNQEKGQGQSESKGEGWPLDTAEAAVGAGVSLRLADPGRRGHHSGGPLHLEGQPCQCSFQPKP